MSNDEWIVMEKQRLIDSNTFCHHLPGACKESLKWDVSKEVNPNDLPEGVPFNLSCVRDCQGKYRYFPLKEGKL